MAEFLVYQYPNEALQVHAGSWKKLAPKDTPNGFVISDAHGDTFYQFETVEHLRWSALTMTLEGSSNVVSISKEVYLNRCQALLTEMKVKDIPKVVFSRVHAIPCVKEQQWKVVFERILSAYPQNLNYLLQSDVFGTWMGSSPEVLLKSDQMGAFESMALAGTLSSSQPDSDWTEKERDEQQYVSDYLETVIQKFGKILNKTDRYVQEAGPVKHLRNDFRFELANEKRWQFVRDFHPTPAVCGVPTKKAKELYEKFEVHERNLYTGIIGLFSENETLLYVNLRCMQLQSERASLYVGGGLTQNSDPNVEWEETVKKSKTLGEFLTL